MERVSIRTVGSAYIYDSLSDTQRLFIFCVLKSVGWVGNRERERVLFWAIPRATKTALANETCLNP